MYIVHCKIVHICWIVLWYKPLTISNMPYERLELKMPYKKTFLHGFVSFIYISYWAILTIVNKEYVTLRKREIMLTHKERPFLRDCVSFLSQVSSCQLSWHTTPPTVAPVSNSEKERRVEFNFSFKFHAIGKEIEYRIFQVQVPNPSPSLLTTVCSTLI